MFKGFSYFLSFLSILLVSCSGGDNYETAYAFVKDGKTFIKLKGKRQLAAHDPGSTLSKKTYLDSIFLQVPSLQNGTINGKYIPARQGNYKYVGNVTIQDDKVRVNLSYDNTDDKKVDPIS
jgi:hypothetical protein